MNFVKENYVTVLLVALILIVLAGVGFFIYKSSTTTNDNNKETSKVEEKENKLNAAIISDDNSNNSNVSNLNTTINQDNVLEGENSFPDEIERTKLEQIADIFNNCNTTNNMRAQGYAMTARAENNKITVLSSGDGLDFYVDFLLDNNILYTEIPVDQNDKRITAVKEILAVVLVDCVGQVNGFQDGVLFKALGQDIAANYTIDNEGVEIKILNNEQKVTIKVDLNSNFSFLN